MTEKLMRYFYLHSLLYSVDFKLLTDHNEKITSIIRRWQQLAKRFNSVPTLILYLRILIKGIDTKKTLKFKKKSIQLSKQIKHLEEVNLAKDHLFSVLAHDLRRPVSMLSALAEIREAENLSQEKRVIYHTEMQDALTHASEMLDNLLNWTASQMEGFKPNIVPVNLTHVLRAVINEFAYDANKKNIKVSQKINADFSVLCDLNMIQLIFRNLISNSIKFTHEGGQIVVDLSENTGIAKITVQDNGVGMSEENMELLNRSTIIPLTSSWGTSHEKGTGIGLLLCKTFTQLMNGRIFSLRTSAFESGCMITILLPKTQSKAA